MLISKYTIWQTMSSMKGHEAVAHVFTEHPSFQEWTYQLWKCILIILK